MDKATLLEIQLHAVMAKLSNNELVECKEEWIEEAVDMFRASLKKQFTPRIKEDFRLRGSNIGKARCQLQHQKAGTPTDVRRDYSFITRMLIGDSFECFMLPIMRMAGYNITDTNAKVELEIEGSLIKGEDDLEIDYEVWDAKTCSPYAFDNKWAEGIEGLRMQDDWGYVGQLAYYAAAKAKQAGGWIVGNKSSGEVRVVGANFTPRQQALEVEKLKETVRYIGSDAPFERCFTPQKEYFRRKLTGNTRVPMTCTFCDFQAQCWPDAVLRPQTNSTAKQPREYWYVEYAEKDKDKQEAA